MRYLLIFVFSGLLTGCIGTDFTDEPLGPKPAQAVIDQSDVSLIKGESQELSFRVLATDGNEIPAEWAWSSRDQAVATVDGAGLVSAIDVGQTWVDGMVSADLADSVLVTVVADPNAVAAVTIEGDTTNLPLGETRQFTARIRNAQGQELTGIPVSWASSNPSIASIDDKGVVTALSDGATQITATADGVNSVPFSLIAGDVSGIRSGMFRGLNGYSTEGTAVLDPQSGAPTLSFGQDFQAQSGPGLYVYLSPEERGVAGGVNLGELTSTSGAQSYEIPNTVNTDNFNFVIIYCQPFGVPFGTCRIE